MSFSHTFSGLSLGPFWVQRYSPSTDDEKGHWAVGRRDACVSLDELLASGAGAL